MAKSRCTAEEVQQVILSQSGVIFACPAQVNRPAYSGRGIIAPNTDFRPDLVDSRGYLPVEWWIMSKTAAKNNIPIKDEGVTSLLIRDRPVLLTSALDVAEHELMGEFANSWPLTKVLDIGGAEKRPRYTSKVHENSSQNGLPEIPPIPCHVHAGDVLDGTSVGHGKTEAFFFPPLDVPPYNLQLGKVKTRLGVRPGVTKEEFLASMEEFGKSDDLYALLNQYEIKPWETWAIEEKVIHAPGPWLTFEIQLPQDDFNMFAWVFGTEFSAKELPDLKDAYSLRGLSSQEQMFNETMDWDMNCDPNFKNRWWRKCDEVLDEGDWGRVVRLFYHIFYGEGLVLHPGSKYQRKADVRPYAGIVWSGEGSINGLKLDCKEKLSKEFLVCPNSPVEYVNTSQDQDLMVFVVFPFASNGK